MSKRKCLSISEKAEIIKDIEGGIKIGEAARKYGLPQPSVSTIWRNRESIKTMVFQHGIRQVKKRRQSDKPDLDRILYLWFNLQRAANASISGPILKNKAEDFAVALGYRDFKCSEGWLSRFKKRHEIGFAKTCGEAKDVNKGAGKDAVSDWYNKCYPEITKGYDDSQIYYADEVSVSCEITPDKTLIIKSERCVEGEQPKEDFTLLFCANKSGSDKRRLFVIGKIKNVKNLTVDYEANDKACMTSQLFEQYLKKWDGELKKEVVLIVKNCPAHPHVLNLKNITMAFLPPSSTSVSQPRDQGIIWSWKIHYRKLSVMRTIEQFEQGATKTLTVPEAVQLMEKAWDRVTAVNIQNCFLKSNKIADNTSNAMEEDEDGVPMSVLLARLKALGAPGYETEVDVIGAAHDNDDDDLVMTQTPDDKEKVASLSSVSQEEDNEEEEVKEDKVKVVPTTADDALNGLKLVESFIRTHNVNDEMFVRSYNYMEKKLQTFKYKTQ